MNAPACYIKCVNPEVEAQKEAEERERRKIYNKRYQEKKKQAIGKLNEVKTVLGVEEVNGETIQEKIREKDAIIGGLQQENKRMQEEYIRQMQRMQEEVHRKELEKEQLRRENERKERELEEIRREIERQRVIRGVEQELERMNERIQRMESMDKIISEVSEKAELYMGAYYFVKELEKVETNAYNNTLIRLKRERERKPLEPGSLDRIVAASNVIGVNGSVSPPPVTVSSLGRI